MSDIDLDLDLELDEGTGRLSDSDLEQDEGTGRLSNSDLEQDEGTGRLSDSDLELDEGTGRLSDSEIELDEGTGLCDSEIEPDSGTVDPERIEETRGDDGIGGLEEAIDLQGAGGHNGRDSPQRIVAAQGSRGKKRSKVSIRTKLLVIAAHERGQGIKSIGREFGVSPKQVRLYIKQKDSLHKLSGVSRKRSSVSGAGRHPANPLLENNLYDWFSKEKNSKRRVTVRRLTKYAEQLGREMGVTITPKLIDGFRARRCLTKQVEKRALKLSDEGAMEKIQKFHAYLRKAYSFYLRRTPSGAFTPADAANMDESPLNFDNSGRSSLQRKGVPNDVRRVESYQKRFATLIATVFASGTQRVRPMLIFKGKKGISQEKALYDKRVKVVFQPNAVICQTLMVNEYIPLFKRSMSDEHAKLLVLDTATSHCTKEVKEKFMEARTVPVFVPGGCTSHVQYLDVFFFGMMKKAYGDLSDEYPSTNERKLTTSERRVLCTKWVGQAWEETIAKVDFECGFRKLGYVWDGMSTSVSLKYLPGYVAPGEDFQIGGDFVDFELKEALVVEIII
ncbi:hypothetical protein BSKO_02677 [Bryopsis sp. KO-2023]|nr:hypothetical protein BSKO_02677 [Bryopsis sp. KO-2023]